MGILKGAMWDEFTRKVQNDEFPTDLTEYVLYSKLMRDNKKTVDWYLKKGKTSSPTEKKKLFRLILGEMRRDNNFNYWMTDQSDKKAMLKQDEPRKRWVIPNDESMWYFIFLNDENTENFIRDWGQKKDWKPLQGSLGKAASFLNRSKLSLFGLLRRVGALDGRAYREKQSEWNPRYEKLKPIMDEIIEKDSAGDASQQSQMNLNVFEREVKRVLDLPELDMGDWENLESILSKYYTESRLSVVRQKLDKLADKLGDALMLKHTNLPEKTEEKPFKYVYAFMETKGFRSEADEETHSSFYDDEYDVIKPVTLEQAKKYLNRYSSIRKSVVGERADKEIYSYKVMELKKDGNGFPLLSKLSKVTGGKKNWLSKIFMEILDINTNLEEHDQWRGLKNKIDREFKFNTEAILNTYLEESFRNAEKGDSNPNIETIPIGEDMNKVKYKQALKRRIGEDEQSQSKWLKYQKDKTAEIDSVVNSIPKVFVDFIANLNTSIREGDGDGGYKDDLIDALGAEKAEDYIGVIMGEQYPRSHGFRQRGSALRGASGEQRTTFSLPSNTSKPLLPLTEFINDIYGLFYEGQEPEGDWSSLNFEWDDFKGGYKTEDLSVELEQFGSFDSPFQDIVDKVGKDTTKLITEYIYLIYMRDVNLIDLVQTKMKKDTVSSDYTMAEFIRVFYAAEESFADTNAILNAVQAIDKRIDEAPKLESEKTGYLLDIYEETGRVPFLNEIVDLEKAIILSIPKIKTGLSTQVEKNLERIIRNKRKLKGSVYWMLEDLIREGFIEKKGEEE